MPKLIIFIILLSSTFCSAQSPDDHVVYPDTSLVIGTYIHTIDDRGDLSTTVLGVISIPDMHLDRPTEYLNYLNQNKPVMKKFEYRTNVVDFKDIQKNCNQMGTLGWELVAVTPIVDTITFLLVFKIEIIE